MKARMNTTVKDLLDGLREALQRDDELAYAYHSNIACMVADTVMEFDSLLAQSDAHEIGNDAATRVMKLLFNTDTSVDMLDCCADSMCQCGQCDPDIDIEAYRQKLINQTLIDQIETQDTLEEEFCSELAAIRRGDRDPQPMSGIEKQVAESRKLAYGPQA